MSRTKRQFRVHIDSFMGEFFRWELTFLQRESEEATGTMDILNRRRNTV